MLAPQPQQHPSRFGSDEHLEWLARRLERNLRFRLLRDDFAALGPDAHRRAARELAQDRLRS